MKQVIILFILAIFVLSSCYWTPESTTGSLFLTFSRDISEDLRSPVLFDSSDVLHKAPPDDKEDNPNKPDKEDKDDGSHKPDKEDNQDKPDNSNKPNKIDGSIEFTHVRILLFSDGELYPIFEEQNYYEGELDSSSSEVVLSGIPVGGNYTIQLELGVLIDNEFSAQLAGESRSFKVSPSGKTTVTVRLAQVGEES